MKKTKNILILFLAIILIIIVIIVIFNMFYLNQNKITNKLEEKKNININTGYTNSVEDNNIEELNKEGEDMNIKYENIKINLIINNKTFSATLNNNETVRSLIQNFPMTLNMSDLNSNEKYNYLNFNLVENAYTPEKINAGDIKLYGNNCLVIFYDNFSNSYSYTDLGKIDNIDEFISELDSGSVNTRFELIK